MNATHTQLIATQKLGDHWSQLNQISLYERNLRSTQLIDAQMLIDLPISRILFHTMKFLLSATQTPSWVEFECERR